jgi:hypothetical protein
MRTAQIILAVGIGLLTNGWAQTPQPPEAGNQVREIAVTAKKYEFSPNPIRIKKGGHVRLVITALDRDHGFKFQAGCVWHQSNSQNGSPSHG